MLNDKELIISIGRSRKETAWRPQRLRWSEFVQRLSTPQKSGEILEEYKKLPKGQQDDLKDVGGFIGGTLKGERRKNDSVEGRCLITLDMDNIPAGQTGEIVKRVGALGCASVIYSTRKHEPAAPRLRVIIPTDRILAADEYEPAARKLAELIGIGYCDPTTFQAARFMYWSSICRNAEYIFTYNDAGFVQADWLLSRYTDWRNTVEWPTVPGEVKRLERNLKRQEEPTKKSGPIGAFCRAYDVPAAIEKFLSDIYEPCGEGRYTYTGGSTAGGAVLYDGGKFLYSHHATDPAGSRLNNAFDLVRLHKFGYMDESALPGTLIHQLPSTKAMSEFAAKDEAVQFELAKKRFEQDENTEKKMYPDIQYSSNGTVKLLPTAENLATLLENEGIKIEYDVILREIKVKCSDAEKVKRFNTPPNGYNNLLVYCTDQLTRAGLRVSTAKAHEWIMTIADGYRYNAAKSYLEVNYMIWGGSGGEIDALFNCLIIKGDKVLYKSLLRKWLCQCVAMAHNDCGSYGADGVLVLKGPHGIGKTTFFRKCCTVGQVYFTEGIQIDGSKDKLIESTECWIGELGELPRSLKDLEYMKAFITAASDIFRAHYDKKKERYPRFASFGATTNSESFLKESTERRFHVIAVIDIDLKRLNSISFEKVWAEAYEDYQKLGQSSFRLTSEEKRLLIQSNKRYQVQREEDALLLERLDWSQPREQWKELTASAVCDLVAQGRYISPVNMGRALKRIGYSNDSEKYPMRILHGYALYLTPTKTTHTYEMIQGV